MLSSFTQNDVLIKKFSPIRLNGSATWSGAKRLSGRTFALPNSSQ
jgi:hypothetical protein